jgi:outer membrane lipoprotein-sorting protein
MKANCHAVVGATFAAACLLAGHRAAWALDPSAGAGAPAAVQAPAGSPPAVEELLSRYAQARGGAAAWAAVQSMGWTGRVETDGPGRAPVPFLMVFKRPGATRFEVIQQTQRSVRVFDGSHGWRMHPGGERGLQVDDYTPEELAAARDACGLDGPLVDPAAKGVKVSVEGSDVVDGRAAWRLRVALPSGAVQRHWIDAQDYRDLRYERTAHDRAGRVGVLTVWLRSYQEVEGLRMPMQIETRLPDGRLADRLVIEKVAINPELSADSFAPPDTRPLKMAPHGGVIVNATGAGGAKQPGGQ